MQNEVNMMMSEGSYGAPPRALIADDQPDVLEALRLLIKGEGWLTEAVTSPAGVLSALEARNYDLLLMDLNYARDTTSGAEGLDLIARIRALDDTLPVVAMTAWGSIELAVEAMRRGVRDFVLKPWENARLLDTLRAQLEQGRHLRQQQSVAAQQSRRRESLVKDVTDAGEIQQGLLPHNLPHLPGCALSVAWRPAREVSGDLFDVIAFNEQQVALCIADAAGKGVPAALLMANVQAAARACAAATPSPIAPRELTNRTNRVVCGNVAPGRFVTFFYGLLDATTNKLTYTNAGHCAPLLVRRDGSIATLDADDAVLGAFPDWEYSQREIELHPGDRLALFTDGLVDAENEAGEEFGEARLANLLQKHQHLSAHELQQCLMREVAAFTGGQFQDDATLLILSVE
jgi:phosphoserine phosphatase RsbU/P